VNKHLRRVYQRYVSIVGLLRYFDYGWGASPAIEKWLEERGTDKFSDLRKGDLKRFLEDFPCPTCKSPGPCESDCPRHDWSSSWEFEWEFEPG